MADQVFIGIGVARPQDMTELPGVEISIKRMTEWAKRERYSIVNAITDKERPVTAARIAKRLHSILRKPIDRMVVYFVGHGFLNSPDQIWILSDGPNVNTGRVSRDALRASIATYRPRQISMIADACLEPRQFPSGTVPVLYDVPGPHRRVFVDNIFSTLPNRPSFFFRGQTEETDFCLFTSVLLDFLNGEDKRAFQLKNGVLPDVTTQTLYWNLPDAVLERGADRGVDQEPRVEPGFPQGDDIYSSFEKTAKGPRRPPKPPKSGSQHRPNAVPRRDLRDSISFNERMNATNSPVPPLLHEGQIERLKASPGGLAALIHREGLNASLGIIVNGAPALPILIRREADSNRQSCWYRVPQQPGPILTISWSANADFFVMIPTFEKLIATVHLVDKPDAFEGGCKQLSWSPDYTSYKYSAKTITAWRALAALTQGRLVHADAKSIADSLRDEKHINPMIGIVCAYLYDLVGDLDSLSRLCYFYVKYDQGIPFDIALLSGGEFNQDGHGGWKLSFAAAQKDKNRASAGGAGYLWKSTPAGVGRVAGVTPLIRPGWSRLATHKHSDLRKIAELADALTGSQIATLMGSEARNHGLNLLPELRPAKQLEYSS